MSIWNISDFSIYSLGSMLIALVLVIIVREIINYRALARFEKVGLPTMYFPIIGVLRWVLYNNCDDKLSPYKQLNAEHHGKKAFAVNYVKGVGRSLVNLLDPETIKKWYAVETSVSYREAPLGHMNAGFFFVPTAHAMKEKMIFTDFFNWQNLEKYNIPVYKIAQDVMKEMTETLGVNGEEYKTINIKEIIKKFLIGFSNYVIFGVKSGKDIPIISDGSILTLAIDEYFD